MRILYLDCFSGISGDMMVGALADLGITPSTFEWELSKLELGDYHLHFERQARGGISGVKFEVHAGATHADAQLEAGPTESHHHAHSEGHENDLDKDEQRAHECPAHGHIHQKQGGEGDCQEHPSS